MRLTTPCLVILIGPSGSGKTTWAADNFALAEVVSSDQLRAVTGIDENDQRASADAFFLLHEIANRRIARGLTCVIDTTGLDTDARLRHLEAAQEANLATYAVCFDTPADICRARNKERSRPIPVATHNKQFSTYKRNREEVLAEGFDDVLFVEYTAQAQESVEKGPASLVGTTVAAHSQSLDPVGLKFGLQISSFPSEPIGTREHLGLIAKAAEEAGFTSFWVMDHLRQIPQVGRAWDDFLEAYVTLGYLAAFTESASLGALVTPTPFRHPALLGKMMATLDVLSGGRSICGLGLGWFEQEARAYGMKWPDIDDRYEMLEDTLQLLPMLWGPGSPEFVGRQLRIPEAMCYPRPLNGSIPLLVGGGGEKRTLRLVAQYADYANLFGEPEAVRAKAEVLAEHCRDLDRDPSEVQVTHLGSALVGRTRSELAGQIERFRSPNESGDQFAVRSNAGTVKEQVGRFRKLADAGVRVAIVNLQIPNEETVDSFKDVIEAFA